MGFDKGSCARRVAGDLGLAAVAEEAHALWVALAPVVKAWTTEVTIVVVTLIHRIRAAAVAMAFAWWPFVLRDGGRLQLGRRELSTTTRLGLLVWALLLHHVHG